MAYQLDLLEEAHIHSTFHVLLLKKWVGKVPFLNQGYQFFIPNKRLNPNLQRSLTKEAKMIEEVLLRWEWQPREDAVLVEKAWLKGVYPHFEGKVFFSIML